MSQQEPQSHFLAILGLVFTLIGALATLLAGGRIPFLRQYFPAEPLANIEAPRSERTPTQLQQIVAMKTTETAPADAPPEKHGDNSETGQPSLATPPIEVLDVLSTSEKNTEAIRVVAMIVKVQEGERTAGYDEMIERALPAGNVLDTRRFNDRAATGFFFKRMANDAKSFFSDVGFLNFARAVVLVEEESDNSGFGNSSYLSVKVTLRVRIIDVKTGRVSLLRKLEAVGAGFTPKQALDDARAKIEFSKPEFEKALRS